MHSGSVAAHGVLQDVHVFQRFKACCFTLPSKASSWIALQINVQQSLPSICMVCQLCFSEKCFIVHVLINAPQKIITNLRWRIIRALKLTGGASFREAHCVIRALEWKCQKHGCELLSTVRGYHVYRRSWTQVGGESWTAARELGNIHDMNAVALFQGDVKVDHIPKKMSWLS